MFSHFILGTGEFPKGSFAFVALNYFSHFGVIGKKSLEEVQPLFINITGSERNIFVGLMRL